MPVIQCPGCRRAFKVGLDVLETEVECPKCQTSFVAQTRRTGPKRKQKSQAPYWIVGTLLAVVVIVLIAAFMGGDEPRGGTGPTAAAGSGDEPDSDRQPGDGAPSEVDPDPVARCADAFALAIEVPDVPTLTNKQLLNFPALHQSRVDAGLAERPWGELSSLDRTLARQEIVQELIGDDEMRSFLDGARRTSLDVVEAAGDRATVQVIYTSREDENTTQERRIHLTRFGGLWTVAGVEIGEVINPELARQRALAAKAELGRERRARAFGEIQHVEHLADTPEADRRRLDELAAKVADPTAAREASRAKNELIEIGKPAIPAFLNVIADRKDDLFSVESQQVINLVIQALHDLTQEDFGFAPGGLAGDLSEEERKANEEALQRWFGWWERSRDGWQPPREKEIILDSFDDDG